MHFTAVLEMAVMEVHVRGKCGGYCVGTRWSIVIVNASALVPNSVPCNVITVAVLLEHFSVEFKMVKGHPVIEVIVRAGLL